MSPNEEKAASRKAVEWNRIVLGDCRQILKRLGDDEVDLSIWSPPYQIGRPWDCPDLESWQALMAEVSAEHGRIVRPGGFVAVNIGDIRTWPDPNIPRQQAELASRRRPITIGDIARTRAAQPKASLNEIAEALGCSRQTIDRRLGGKEQRGARARNDVRRLLETSRTIVDEAAAAGLYVYDHRIWAKGPAWHSSPWHPASYRAVDEWEHVYLFCRPGPMRIERGRLSPKEWTEWGSRGIWTIASVGRQGDEAAFPTELASRLIRLLTDEGERVLDPFCGTGTTVVAANRLERQWLGIDVRPGAIRNTRRRLREQDRQPTLFTNGRRNDTGGGARKR